MTLEIEYSTNNNVTIWATANSYDIKSLAEYPGIELIMGNTKLMWTLMMSRDAKRPHLKDPKQMIWGEVAKVTVTDISQLKLLFSAPVYDAGNAVLPVKDPSVNAAIVVQPVPQPIMQPI